MRIRTAKSMALSSERDVELALAQVMALRAQLNIAIREEGSAKRDAAHASWHSK